MTYKATVEIVADQGKTVYIALATELFFNEGIPQKMHWIICHFWLNLTLITVINNQTLENVTIH